jgi:hypothetical protein
MLFEFPMDHAAKLGSTNLQIIKGCFVAIILEQPAYALVIARTRPEISRRLAMASAV